jgi:hypothetical protein
MTQRAKLVAAKANFACEVKGKARPEALARQREDDDASAQIGGD